jgi:PAS domain S-box-containing protein
MPVKKRRVTKGKTKNGDQKTVSRLSEDTAKSKRLSAGSGKRALVLRRSSDKEPSIMMENIPSSLDQIDTIISIVNQPMLAMDFNLQVISANPPFCQTFKISPDKLKGALFYQIGNGLWDVPELKAKLEHVVYDNTLFENVELKLKLPPHQELKIRVSSKIIEDQHKKPQFIFLSFTDITERRKPDETTGDVHSFPDVNPMPVIETDRSGKVLYMNPSAKKLFPQLATTGIRHPFLAELPSAVTELKEGGKAWVRRQVKAEGKWYGQTIYPVENGSRIRIYSADITDAIWVRQVLEASERRFKSIYAESPMGIELFDLDGKLVDANRACLDIFGVSDVTDIKGFNLFEDPNLTVEQKKILKEGKTVSYEGPFDFEKIKEHKLYPTSKSGIIHLDVTVTPLAAAGEEPQKGYLVQVQDITERKHKEDKLRQLNRVLRALSDSNQAMMRSTGESDYMNEVCRLIIDDCGYAMVWIGLAQDDENKTVRPVAQAGFEEGYLETVNITWSDTERGRGPTGTAIRTGKPAVCRNILTDPNFEPWRKEALKRGYASSIVIPLISNDRTLGAINIYSKEPDPFSEEEIDLLTELSSDLAYGITTFRLRIAHQEAEAALAKSEEKYKFLYEEGQSFNLIIGPDQTVKDVNKVALDILSYKINNVIGRPALDFIPQEDQERVKGILAETFTGGTTQEYEVPVLAKDGSVHIILFAPGQATLREGESITGIVVTGIDITERKKAEDALLRAKEEWERTFESVPDLIAILDNRHKIVRMNRAMNISLSCMRRIWGAIFW